MTEPADLERRAFGATGMDVTVLGFGGAEIGYERTDLAVVERLLNSALDAGLNVIDTAECYVDSEEAIGKTVSHRRKDYWLFTKVGHMEPEGWTPGSIERSIERSLTRLRTDHVDLVLLHSCGKDVLEKGECIDALEASRKAGKTRFIGYSGDSHAARFAVESGRFDALQTSVNFVDQESIEKTIPLARQKRMGVIAKRPIANAVWRHESEPTNNYVVEYWRRMKKLGYDFTSGEPAKDPGPDGAAGVALRFTLSVPGVHVAIVGTSNPDRWKMNARMLREGGALPSERFDAIREQWKKMAPPEWVGQI
ncbi:MAG: aldo/keto reductase [Phycisphaerae bacterium]|nr:aldo/keto reductase [Phycisphaerae bacterium]